MNGGGVVVVLSVIEVMLLSVMLRDDRLAPVRDDLNGVDAVEISERVVADGERTEDDALVNTDGEVTSRDFDIPESDGEPDDSDFETDERDVLLTDDLDTDILDENGVDEWMLGSCELAGPELRNAADAP